MVKNRTKGIFGEGFKRIRIVLTVFIAVCILFGIISRTFFTAANITNIMLTVSITGTLALGMTFAVVSGGYDLSMGYGLAFSGVIAGYTMTKLGLPEVVAILAALVFGALLGLTNGLMVTKMKLPPFIATLGTMMLCQGLALIITEGKVYNLPSAQYPIFTGLVKNSVLGAIIPAFNVSNAIVLFVIFAVIAHFILNSTILGKYILSLIHI